LLTEREICGLIVAMSDNLSEAEKNHHRDLLIINAKPTKPNKNAKRKK
jgi:hypothetical protein